MYGDSGNNSGLYWLYSLFSFGDTNPELISSHEQHPTIGLALYTIMICIAPLKSAAVMALEFNNTVLCL
jgi:hypothetical protein